MHLSLSAAHTHLLVLQFVLFMQICRTSFFSQQFQQVREAAVPRGCILHLLMMIQLLGKVRAHVLPSCIVCATFFPSCHIALHISTFMHAWSQHGILSNLYAHSVYQFSQVRSCMATAGPSFLVPMDAIKSSIIQSTISLRILGWWWTASVFSNRFRHA